MWQRTATRVIAGHVDKLVREQFGREIADVFLSHERPLGSQSVVELYTHARQPTLSGVTLLFRWSPIRCGRRIKFSEYCQ